MFKCEVCGSHEAHQEDVEEVFHIQNRYLLVEHIPATVCAQCGEKVFSAGTAESIRLMLHDHRKPVRSIEMDVFAY
jgi:YgiT-type zinc finger domain-containing protein